jgi:exopolyphosphatase/guanosine-5'-triphosphate,3'-diphosphate pyrophosphatase
VSADSPRAVIDLGSNTARVVVFRIEHEGTFDVLADTKVSLRLIRNLDTQGNLPAEVSERAIRVLRDFRQIAVGSGARKVIAVATAALREANNGDEFLQRARRLTGLPIRLLPPEAEARCAFLGAVYEMAVEHGLVLDIGGGSLQMAYFRDRALRSTWSLPLGALRISDRFLKSDPPHKQEIRRLEGFAVKTLARAGIPELSEDEVLIGTGGTIRNLGKIDARLRGYPITRLHGYVLTLGRVRALNEIFCGRRSSARTGIPGLNSSRTDSITGGGLLTEAVLEQVGAGRMLVAGLGLREGLLLEALGMGLPAPESVRAHAVRALVSRFSGWDEARAARRKRIAEQLASALFPPEDEALHEMTGLAATLLDIGRTVEYYSRHEHAAMILRSAGLEGFTHREVLYLSLIIEVSEKIEWKERSYRPLLRNGDLDEITRSAIVLSLSDEIEHRIPLRRAPRLLCRVSGGAVALSEPALASWDPGNLAVDFDLWFGKKLKVTSLRPRAGSAAEEARGGRRPRP